MVSLMGVNFLFTGGGGVSVVVVVVRGGDGSGSIVVKCGDRRYRVDDIGLSRVITDTSCSKLAIIDSSFGEVKVFS